MRAAAPPDRLADQLARLGVAIVEHALGDDDLKQLELAFPRLGDKGAGARSQQFGVAARDLIAGHAVLGPLAERLAGGQVRVDRLIAFDKRPEANWFVPWHQDRSAEGRERDLQLLAGTITLRVHLDPCEDDNGPLEVIPGTHVMGRLEGRQIAEIATTRPGLVCLAARGDIVAIRPLLLHRSQRARKPSARRVIHIEYVARNGTGRPVHRSGEAIS